MHRWVEVGAFLSKKFDDNKSYSLSIFLKLEFFLFSKYLNTLNIRSCPVTPPLTAHLRMYAVTGQKRKVYFIIKQKPKKSEELSKRKTYKKLINITLSCFFNVTVIHSSEYWPSWPTTVSYCSYCSPKLTVPKRYSLFIFIV